MKWTRVIVWKNFSNGFQCYLMAGDDTCIGTYFKTIFGISGPNKEYKHVGYLYTGYPCGSPHKEFADESISQREPNRYHSIEEMYQMAMDIGFTEDQIDAFIYQQESCWVYDEDGKIVGHASGWHWEFD